ncbi:ABC transporter substrate-binding protein [Pseudoroseomonas rhizosphaerae]|uniref:ABC transporter substrate-binding protein n=1 Tax=Teichococcus rhizosphaerae TaxID=1335062 RepID=A0A2C6Z4S0_9PROT|nr:extracellular solute-binding protein [Pseudoroseomonas rhizosphaerae]PHK93501.1 ABC transporter substrate-binding protein [Pseudoroseomonas rhizosphaerae]
MQRLLMTRRGALGMAAGAAAAVSSAPARAQAALEPRLVIITSFSRDVTTPFVQAFEQRHPGTKVEVQNRSTTAAVAFVRETRSSPPDLFWASAPDAFEVMKQGNLLARPQIDTAGIPATIGAQPTHDAEGRYFGFAVSGYGMMYNTRYLRANRLPVPKEWADLKNPAYQGHVGISSPSRSGTTHLTIETILQGEGWEPGWAQLLEIAGNFAQVSDRSFGVPDAVNSGQYGIGIVIDFFGFSAKASGFPVEFVYPTVTTLVPANIAMIEGSKSPNAARAFIQFLLSPAGQEVLLDPKVMRLPVRPETYAKAPAGFPNPFRDQSLGARVKFDNGVSEARYELLNSLFDRLITFRLRELTEAWKAVHAAEAALARSNSAQGRELLAQARARLTRVPVTEAQAADPAIAGAFQPARPDRPAGPRQAQLEEEWDRAAVAAYAEARQLAERAQRAS